MRNRTPDSTTPAAALETTLETTDPWVWYVTEKGLRASGAAHMQATAASLREAAAELEKAARRLNQDVPIGCAGASPDAPVAPAQVLRRCTISYRYRNDHQVPELAAWSSPEGGPMEGVWLRNAGFDLGQKVAVKVDDRQLTICAEA